MLVGSSNSVRHLSSRQPDTAAQYFHHLARLLADAPYTEIDEIITVLQRAFEEEHTVFVFGNGGSASSASHMVSDMNKGLGDARREKRMKVMSLTDNVPLLTACANDQGYETVFSEQLKNFIQPGDVAFAISCSGDSGNVLRALTAARQAGAFTVGLSGFAGGAMKDFCDVCAIVPSENMQMIEDVHHAMLHAMFTVLRERIGARYAPAMAMSAANRVK